MIVDVKNFKSIKEEHIKFCNAIIKKENCTFTRSCNECPFASSNAVNGKTCIDNNYADTDIIKNNKLVQAATAFIELADMYMKDKKRIHDFNVDILSLRDIKKILAFQNSMFLKDFCYTYAGRELQDMISSSDINILFFDDESIGNISIWCTWSWYEEHGNFDFDITEKEFEELLNEYNEQLLKGGNKND